MPRTHSFRNARICCILTSIVLSPSLAAPDPHAALCQLAAAIISDNAEQHKQQEHHGHVAPEASTRDLSKRAQQERLESLPYVLDLWERERVLYRGLEVMMTAAHVQFKTPEAWWRAITTVPNESGSALVQYQSQVGAANWRQLARTWPNRMETIDMRQAHRGDAQASIVSRYLWYAAQQTDNLQVSSTLCSVGWRDTLDRRVVVCVDTRDFCTLQERQLCRGGATQGACAEWAGGLDAPP